MRSQNPINISAFLIVIILLASGAQHSVHAQAGQLDLTFNNAGHKRFGFGGGSDKPSAIAVQSDGKVVVVGSSSDAWRQRISILRYNLDGSLDPSFNFSGWRSFNIGAGESQANAVALQADGKILVAGFLSNGVNKDFAVLRFNPDGSTDMTFGINGLATIDFIQADDDAKGVVVQGDGRILVVGSITSVGASWSHIAAVRYNPDGTLDTSFNGSGRVTTAGGYASSVAIQPDGKIVVGASCIVGVSVDFCAVRFTAEGPLDSSFNGTGRAVTSDTGTASSLAIQPDGKIVLGGFTQGGAGFTVVRYNPDGSSDNSFGKAGRMLSGFAPDNFNSGAGSMNLLPDGRIFLLGYTSDRIAAIRLRFDGGFDNSLNGSGTLVTSVTSGGDRGYASIVENDEKILIAGTFVHSDTSPSSRSDFLLTKLNPDGSLDTTFGTTGFTTVDIGDAPDRGKSVARQPNGKIVVAGNWVNNGAPRVARLNPDGSFDTTFNGTGKVVLTGPNGYEVADVIVQADNKIVVASNFGGSIKLNRLNPDGTLDSLFGTAGIVEINNSQLNVNAIASQPDGKILVGGSFLAGQGLVLMRLDAQGYPDRTFGRNGIFTAVIGVSGGNICALALKPDGKILAAGMTMVGDQNTAFLLARFNSNGSVDTTFADDGYSFMDVSPWYDFATSMAVHSDGKIAVGGYSRRSAFENEFVVVKYNENGSPDVSFNGDGVATKDLGLGLETKATGLGFQPDGKIILGGHFQGIDSNLGAVRFSTDGNLDEQWGEQGVASAVIGGDDYSYGMVLDNTGRPIMVGESTGLVSLIRFTSDPVAASFVSVSGRVTDSNGNPINRATVSMTDATGSTRTAQTNAFGYYRLDDVRTGATYTFTVSAKRYRFLPQSVTVGGELTDVDFVPNEGIRGSV